ncbi:hypothetical protein GUITHDRAFT_150343 [Guillardia theta CCMP2712]|uniref:Uncharacterized protein n=1 Tax=Guillardia theta (strain CCMP2712) TaxID=905079 RepID=L1JXZ4_GUITC|nr:hypothetical protein GUITHDRAFT_150343 [Guillardia theta CCMP2712]EKX53204.1 hypothetical protein GUITHDRAFT_150343 [Guillardia theta CCMP2712]|eukprot:XP_005840184.1 hypothetical protein GUITHDRAFT_150343 [Guillardia theta CCMP2712]
MEERTKDLERDIANFQRQLESQTAQLQERMKRMKGRDDDMEQDLSKRIDKAKEERRRVERLEEDVWGNYLHAKSALAGLKEDTKEREQSTDASMASLERELNNNQGAADSITRIQQTLAALKTRINELARGVGVKSDGLRTKEADANELGEVATAFLRSELERLQRLLDSSVNERRRIRSQAEGSMRDFQLRLEKFRGDLRQINATWNAYDQP